MKCVLFLAVSCILLVIADSANECKLGISCLNKGVCKMLGGKSKGTCFQGVCCKRGRKHSCSMFGGECQSKNITCKTLRKASQTCGKRKKCCVWVH
ncbi:hypothetical protein MTO96_050866 [Rhipicephalus appendiculatus]|uniref:Carboxypeptidase inhibitor n=1 Tax=Rhipicephalus appendiculatus TaxID=34631 RepID=A0A131YT78_RHIAP